MTRCLRYSPTISAFREQPSDREAAYNPEIEYLYILGDLHGCALKLLLFFVALKVCEIPPKQVENFTIFYTEFDRKNPLALSQTHLYQLDLGPILRKVRIMLIGDVICDRGKSDYLILYVINKIIKHGITLEIVLGNHDLTGILAFTVVSTTSSSETLSNTHNLQKCRYTAEDLNNYRNIQFKSREKELLENSLTSNQHLTPILSLYISFMAIFIENIILLKRIESNGRNFLITHAPFTKETFEGLIKSISPYNTKIEPTLAFDNIPQINGVVKEMLQFITNPAQRPQVGFLPILSLFEKSRMLNIRSFVWNRVYDKITNPYSNFSSSQFTNVHGHDGPGDFSGNTLNINAKSISLDTYFGRPGDDSDIDVSNEKQITGLPGSTDPTENMWVLEIFPIDEISDFKI